MAQADSDMVNDDLSEVLANMTLVHLKQKLKQRRLKTSRSKNELISRFVRAMRIERGMVGSSERSKDSGSHDDESDDEEDENEGDATIIEREGGEISNDNIQTTAVRKGQRRNDSKKVTVGIKERNMTKEN
ncbi:uncharacterized protein LOC105189424 [Harpegnathos saltator]|uniref:uncharacterized protein LOC105189424 n=1 Tax=Harpegnathos saltator TaxID=610380 RepID=UPI0005912144|nr:uncharacterized protein LOC105189424 [Harpegnathos saltator]